MLPRLKWLNIMQAVISWAPVAPVPGLSYQIKMFKNGVESLGGLSGALTSCTTPVTAGMLFAAQVRALSVDGPGEWSDAVPAVIVPAPPPVLPEKVTGVTITFN